MSTTNVINSINSKNAKIAIIGLGYVGLPLVLAFCKAGFRVTGFDVDPEKAEKLRQGKSYIKHIDSSLIARFVIPSFADEFNTQHSFFPTTDFSLLSAMDCIIICVPTPLSKNREPDMTYVFGTAKTIAQYLRKGQLIVLESTTYPGTTDEDMRAILEETGLKAGTDFHLAFSPEREDPNNKDFSTSTIPKVVGGYTEQCLAIAQALYNSIVEKTVPVSSTKIAEATKLLENIYRSVNIALVNELKILFDRMGIDVWEVIEAAKTKPFGFQAFYPGPGLGGHCIPIDPFYLTWKAREYEFSTRFIELAGEINTIMPRYVIYKTMEALNEKGKSVKGSKILLLGLSYKKNVDDMRESPSLRLIELLEEKGAKVDYHDPYIPKPPKLREHKLEKESVALTDENLAKYDCVVIATDHSVYDGEFILKNSQLIIDTRNLIKNHTNHSDKVKRA
ncbi:MAG: nucleotide sugar dehydrogenase [Candidatus Loosdrechtia sp.]|uniref:nucleotide sugar dehydrogenase n=1 Tax=Candidatus Loosdrechtia sp. TaxID=3101272 RepID=UPI003A5E7CEC|nr:MAG: nucleotide sugar dehydrogenase [Candidatus Jettenia sp. AMX2]